MKKVIKILGLVIFMVVTALILEFSYVWFFSEAKTETVRVIIILIAGTNLLVLTRIFLDSIFEIARNGKNLREE